MRQREYVKRRRYDIADRLAIVIQFTVIWLLIVLITIGKLGILGAIIGLIIFKALVKFSGNFIKHHLPGLYVLLKKFNALCTEVKVNKLCFSLIVQTFLDISL